MRKWLILMALVALTLPARSRRVVKGDPGLDDYKVHTIGELWSAVSNFGNYGDPNSTNTGRPSYDWPGGTHNYYLWEGRLWIGAAVGGETLVSHADYGDYEWHPSEDYPTGWGYIGPRTSMYDINAVFDDYADSKALGLKVFQKAMAWSMEPYNSIFAYELKVTYDKTKFYTGAGPDALENLYVAWVFDADVCNEDPTDCHIDDLVSFDGWVAGEWKDFEYTRIPTDTLVVLSDTVLRGSDSIPDQYTIWGDDPDERVVVKINGETYMHTIGTNDIVINGEVVQSKPFYRKVPIDGGADTFNLLIGDTLVWSGGKKVVHVEIVPRNMSFIFDGDNPAEPGDDMGEGGACAGRIFGRIVYAPPSPADSVWVTEDGDTCRIIRAFAHQWWNWESDPGTDIQKYRYMNATHPDNFGHRFMPHPFDVGAPTFDYRFMLVAGPYTLAHGDTLRFVYVAGVGQGMNGGEDTYWGRGYRMGARHYADWGLVAYYKGASHSDPYHPSAPNEDVHWLIPVPPEVPHLVYSAAGGVVTLTWDDIAETTPDPMDGMYDFAGYRVYRSAYRPNQWELLADFDTAYAREHGGYPHTYVDSTAIPGVAYYYAVTAYDLGRPATETTPALPPLESGKTNYKKTETGAPIPVYVKTEMNYPEIDWDAIKVVPNPYFGSAKWELEPGSEYMNKIQFVNLPPNCRIKIYTIDGDLVIELKHEEGTGDVYWNLLSRNNQDVVSGIYIYKVEAYDQNGNFIGSKVGKFMILR